MATTIIPAAGGEQVNSALRLLEALSNPESTKQNIIQFGEAKAAAEQAIADARESQRVADERIQAAEAAEAKSIKSAEQSNAIATSKLTEAQGAQAKVDMDRTALEKDRNEFEQTKTATMQDLLVRKAQLDKREAEIASREAPLAKLASNLDVRSAALRVAEDEMAAARVTLQTKMSRFQELAAA